MSAAVAYPLAALAEIAGCFAIWAWWRLEASPLWLLPGVFALPLCDSVLATL
jgi:small multidrug resistance family-3 protein